MEKMSGYWEWVRHFNYVHFHEYGSSTPAKLWIGNAATGSQNNNNNSIFLLGEITTLYADLNFN